MLRCMTLAAAVLVSTSAMATCLEDRNGAQCDLFLDDYRTSDVPIGTTMVWPQRPFLLEEIDRRGGTNRSEAITGNDVLYWDGEDAFIVPENSGPQVKIADW